MGDSNFDRGRNAAKEGLGISDAWGDILTMNSDGIPSTNELDDWIDGWKSWTYPQIWREKQLKKIL